MLPATGLGKQTAIAANAPEVSEKTPENGEILSVATEKNRYYIKNIRQIARKKYDRIPVLHIDV